MEIIIPKISSQKIGDLIKLFESKIVTGIKMKSNKNYPADRKNGIHSSHSIISSFNSSLMV